MDETRQVRILIAEDDVPSMMLLKRTLQKAGFEIVAVRNGVEALDAVRKQEFDAVLTDWMMPQMDGIELIKQIRLEIKDSPFIAIVTAIASDEARIRALESGADDYLSKPYLPEQVLDILSRGLSKKPGIRRTKARKSGTGGGASAVQALGIAASTGGPPSVRTVVESMGLLENTAVFIVLHGPAWMLESYWRRLADVTEMEVALGEHGCPISAGTIYLAPGDYHMTVSDDGKLIQLDQEAPENFVRPAADPLFRSLAKVYRNNCVAVILTGMGKDGTVGAGYIAAAGGIVMAQDPSTAIMPSMPRTAIDMRIPRRIEPLQKLGAAINEEISNLKKNF
jgi:two-component system chemotaxis response regulator CheB